MSANSRPLDVIPYWHCPACPGRYPLPGLWEHLETAHGLPREAIHSTHAATCNVMERALTYRLLRLIEDAMASPDEYIPSRIRFAARDVRSVLDYIDQAERP